MLYHWRRDGWYGEHGFWAAGMGGWEALLACSPRPDDPRLGVPGRGQRLAHCISLLESNRNGATTPLYVSFLRLTSD